MILQEGIIRIEELQVFAHHGVFEDETRDGQNFYINAELIVPLSESARTDNLEETVNYGEVCEFLDTYMHTHTYKLLEALCENMAMAVLAHFPLIREITLQVRKPEAPIPLSFESVSVETTRGRHIAYLAFGSNIGDSKNIIETALGRLGEQWHTKILQQSSVIVTKPYGYTEQPDFLNGVVCVETMLSPMELLSFMQEIENAAGRTREIHWGPRTLDLDMIFYEDEICGTKDLVLPHPDMQNRDFVLKPMCEIAPWLRHPVSGETMQQLLDELE